MSDLPRILIVDNSRVVRASLAKNLQGRFEVREEADGEAAWQTLVLDSSIAAVIAGAHLHKLDGYGLVERLRESRLHRLKDMPFLLIVSDAESEEGKARAKARGVSDFITKLLARDEIMARLARLLDQPAGAAGDGDFAAGDIDGGAALKRVGKLNETPGGCACDPNEHLPAIEAQLHLLSGSEIEGRIARALAAAGDGAPVSVLALGIDNYEALVGSFGEDSARQIGLCFAKLLTGKIGLRDSIGLYRPDCCVIVSREANLGRCYTFAGRVCRSMATAQIKMHGQPVDMAVCAGAASAPEDGALSGTELLALAVGRMEATRCACNGVEVPAAPGKAAQAATEIPDLRSLASLVANQPELLEPQLGTIGLRLLPLFNMLEREFRFGLPLLEMASRLAERARQEKEQAQ